VSFSDRVAEGVVSMFASARLMAMSRWRSAWKSHIGWTAGGALAGPAASAEVVAKRRIDMATTFDEGAVYHKWPGAPFDRAEALIPHPRRNSSGPPGRRCRLSSPTAAAGCEWWRADWFPATGKRSRPGVDPEVACLGLRE